MRAREARGARTRTRASEAPNNLIHTNNCSNPMLARLCGRLDGPKAGDDFVVFVVCVFEVDEWQEHCQVDRLDQAASKAGALAAEGDRVKIVRRWLAA